MRRGKSIQANLQGEENMTCRNKNNWSISRAWIMRQGESSDKAASMRRGQNLKGSVKWSESLKFSSGLKCKEWITMWEERTRLEPGRPVGKWCSDPGGRGWSLDLRWWLWDWKKKMLSFKYILLATRG